MYVRKSRGIFRRMSCSSAFHCDHCGADRYFYRPFFAIFQWHAYCPKCHNFELSRLKGRDRIDPMSFNPFRSLLRLFGFPLYYCTLCRFQFGDFHPLHPGWKVRRLNHNISHHSS